VLYVIIGHSPHMKHAGHHAAALKFADTTIETLHACYVSRPGTTIIDRRRGGTVY
jgi:hypothetical protein